MGKSLRNKSKLAARRQKRDGSWYAVAHDERVQRLHNKLMGKDADGDVKVDGEEKEGEGSGFEDVEEGEGMEVEGEVKIEDGEEVKITTEEPSTSTKKISTSAPRSSRRETWRVSKGLPIRPERHGLNRLGMAKGRRRSGRAGRRR